MAITFALFSQHYIIVTFSFLRVFFSSCNIFNRYCVLFLFLYPLGFFHTLFAKALFLKLNGSFITKLRISQLQTRHNLKSDIARCF